MNEIPLNDSAPGGLVVASFTDVGPDPDGALAEARADVLVCLVRDEEIAMRYPAYATWLAEAGDRAIRLPIPDYGITEDALLSDLVAQIVELVTDGKRVLVHCGGGIGRAGIVSILVLTSLGWSLSDASLHVRASRPGAGPDSVEQQAQLDRLGPVLSG